MKLFRTLLTLTFAGMASAAAAQDAADFPNRAVRMIMPFEAGGSNDILGRYIGEKLSAHWGQPVVVENIPGAGSAIGTAQAARAEPDGYTIVAASVSYTMTPAVRNNIPYDPATDLKPVAVVALSPLVVMVGAGIEANSMDELLELARQQNLTIATSGVGSIGHFAGALLARSTGVTMTPVHYRGGAPAIVDMLGGHVDVFISSLPQAIPQIQQGALGGLAITSEERASSLPDVPTLAETGIEGAEVEQWFGILAPAGTPDEIVAKINADINEVLSSEEVTAFLIEGGSIPVMQPPEALGERIQRELETWRTVALEAEIQPE